MARESPLRKQHEAHAAAEAARTPVVEAAARPGAATGRRVASGLEFIDYGPPGPGCPSIPATFGSVEAEYAALRRAAGLLDGAQRGVLRVRGAERLEFLNRMLTQQLADLEAGTARVSFWLNRKGRIEADLLLAETGGEMLVDLDAHVVAATAEALQAFVFAEDVAIEDATEQGHRISVHGPAAAAAVPGADALEPGHCRGVSIDGAPVTVVRRDEIGAPGLELFMRREDAGRVWAALLEAGESSPRPRPVGWYAYNIARIEAGTPLFNVDFGSTNLPHETGVLDSRVSFTKGCYLGQEVVARMQSLGRPKQVLAGLRVQGEALPVAGDTVFAAGSDGAAQQAVGVVTSSTLSPMLGGAAIAFAMLRTTAAEEGRTVLVVAEGCTVPALVGPLRMWTDGAR